MRINLTWDDIDLFVSKPEAFGFYLGYKDLIPLHGKWIKPLTQAEFYCFYMLTAYWKRIALML